MFGQGSPPSTCLQYILTHPFEFFFIDLCGPAPIVSSSGYSYKPIMSPFCSAVYITNHLPTAALNHDVPFLKLYNKILNYEFMRICNCACYPFLRHYNQHKLTFKSQECLFLGSLKLFQHSGSVSCVANLGSWTNFHCAIHPEFEGGILK